jgi:hypothetical protein
VKNPPPTLAQESDGLLIMMHRDSERGCDSDTGSRDRDEVTNDHRSAVFIADVVRDDADRTYDAKAVPITDVQELCEEVIRLMASFC